jgi:hypothetical protein
MKKLFAALLATSVASGAVFGGVALAEGEGHTPIVVCHWVPAHGGSYVEIVVDDDGADGNKSVQAHSGHENDLINPVGDSCDGDDDYID